MADANQLNFLDNQNVIVKEEIDLGFESIAAEGYRHQELVSVKEAEKEEKQLALQELVSVKEEIKEEKQLPFQEFEFLSVKDEIKNEEQFAHQDMKYYPAASEDVKDPLAFEEEDHHSTVTAKYSTWSVQGAVENQITESQEAMTNSRPNPRRDCKCERHHCGGDGANVQSTALSQTLTCATCSAVFMSKYSLIRHVFSHIDFLPPPSNICQLCGDVFFSPVFLREHSIICPGFHHENSLAKCKCEKRPEGEREFCEKSVKQYISLEREQNSQNKSKLKTSVHKKPLSSSQLVLLEKLKHKTKSLKCEICGKIFSRPSQLPIHNRVHTGEKPFGCGICGKSFYESGELLRHKRVHTGEKPFGCDICGKSFSDSGKVKIHKRTHTGEKPFGCDICGKSFSLSWNLKIHNRIHTGEKPFVCVVCGKSFSTSGTLKKHKYSHTGEKPFKCENCGKSFSQSRSVKSHKCVYTGETHMDVGYYFLYLGV